MPFELICLVIVKHVWEKFEHSEPWSMVMCHVTHDTEQGFCFRLFWAGIVLLIVIFMTSSSVKLNSQIENWNWTTPQKIYTKAKSALSLSSIDPK